MINDIFEVAVEAEARRAPPVLLTTGFGLLSMLMEASLQARFLIPMAVSIAFGIIYASIVIIFLVPAIIVIVDDFKRLGTGGNNKVRARAEAL